MKSCQLPISLSKAISPTTMITILPVGWLLYAGGSLPVETFITTIVLSLGIAGPLLSAMDFVDSLAMCPSATTRTRRSSTTCPSPSPPAP